MLSNFFILMKFELLVAVIIFVLLFIKVGSSEWKNKTALRVVNILLLVNFIAGFFMNHDGTLFGDMFRTTKLIELQKKHSKSRNTYCFGAGICMVKGS